MVRVHRRAAPVQNVPLCGDTQALAKRPCTFVLVVSKRPTLAIPSLLTFHMRTLCEEKNYGKWFGVLYAVSLLYPCIAQTTSDISLLNAPSTSESTTQLTTISEMSPESNSTASAPLGKIPLLSNPFEKQDLLKVLSRKYLVSTKSWLATDVLVPETPLHVLRFPAALFAIANIQDKLANFAWLRADLSLEIRVSSTPYHIGGLVVSWLPNARADSDAELTWAAHCYQRFQNNARFLNPSVQNAITFDIPRLCNWFADNTDGDGAGDVASVYFDVLNQLELSGQDGVPEDLTISIFASFKNPEVSGYGYQTPSAMRAKRVVRQHLNKQSGPGSISKSDPIAQETQKKSSQGVISGSLNAMSNFSPMVSSGPFEALAPIFDVAKNMASFAASVGFSKPASEAASQPVNIDSYSDLNHTQGLFIGNKLSLTPGAKLASGGCLEFKKHSLRDLIVRPSLIHSTYIDADTDINTPIIVFRSSPMIAAKYSVGTDHYYQPTFAGYLAQMFLHYRGSMKYKFQFITSQFVSCRLRITQAPSGTFPVDIEESAGDAVSKILDLKASHEEDVVCVYQNPQGYADCAGFYDIEDALTTISPNDDNNWIMLSLITKVTGPVAASNNKIYINIWAAGAEDLMFKDFHGLDYKETAGAMSPSPAKPRPVDRRPVLKKQSMVDAFAKPFAPLIPAIASMEAGLISVEHPSCVEELCMRMSRCTLSVPSSTVWPQPLMGINNTIVFSFAQLFRYYRGGMRMRITPNALNDDDEFEKALGVSGQYPVATVGSSCRLGNHAILYSKVAGSFNVEIPWMSPMVGRETHLGDASRAQENYRELLRLSTWYGGTALNFAVLMVAVADDFEFSHICSIPPLQFTLPASLDKKGKHKEKENSPTEKIDQGLLERFSAQLH